MEISTPSTVADSIIKSAVFRFLFEKGIIDIGEFRSFVLYDYAKTPYIGQEVVDNIEKKLNKFFDDLNGQEEA